MHYKKYRRPTVREALRAVKEDLGPSALVLSTRMVPSRGIRGWMGARVVEVTAAVDREEVSEERITRPADRQVNRLVTAAVSSAAPSAAMVQQSSVAARLEATGMEPAVARKLAEHPALRQRGAETNAIRRTLIEQFAALTIVDEQPAPVQVFVGPPGVGKTTTIAKIAAQARAREATRFGLVAADGFRVGAVEQLRLYADIIGSPFMIARSGAELSAALGTGRRPLLVDTAGRSPRDTGAAEILEALAGRSDVRRHLVLPAGTPPSEARRVIERFSVTAPDRLVLTRLDEVETLGPLVGVLQDSGLPISYLGFGQNVPDDLQRATAPVLADWVLGEAPIGSHV
jgi:flagellar biosynthesis protein FlhF